MKVEQRIKKIIKEELAKLTRDKGFNPADFFNLDKVPEDELKRQYLLGLRVTQSYGSIFSYDGKDILKEDAAETVGAEQTVREIKKRFSLSDWQAGIEDGANSIKLIFLIPSRTNDEQVLIAAMESYGWSESVRVPKIDNLGNKWMAISFDPIFQDDVAEEARKYHYLFHWSPKYNVPSILKNGLEPRSENEIYKYTSRIHLLKGNISDKNIYHIGNQLCNRNKNPNNDGNYVLLNIDTTKLPDRTRFFYDPRYEYGYYVKDTIPPEAITINQEWNFKRTHN